MGNGYSPACCRDVFGGGYFVLPFSYEMTSGRKKCGVVGWSDGAG